MGVIQKVVLSQTLSFIVSLIIAGTLVGMAQHTTILVQRQPLVSTARPCVFLAVLALVGVMSLAFAPATLVMIVVRSATTLPPQLVKLTHF